MQNDLDQALIEEDTSAQKPRESFKYAVTYEEIDGPTQSCFSGICSCFFPSKKKQELHPAQGNKYNSAASRTQQIDETFGPGR